MFELGIHDFFKKGLYSPNVIFLNFGACLR